MKTDLLIFGPVILPLVGSALVLLLKFLPSAWSKFLQHAAILIFLVCSLLLLGLQYPLVHGGQSLTGIVGQWQGPLGIAWKQDPVSWISSVLGLVLILFAWLYSLDRGPSNTTFGAILLVQASGIAATLLTHDLFNLFVCLEILGITSYIMIAMNKGNGAKLASLTYLLLSAASMIFYLLGLYGLYRLTGALSLNDIGQALTNTPLTTSLAASLGLIIAGVALRSALLPLYGWLPEAHAQAPHAVSAILSGVMIKTPLFALTRILLEIPAARTVGLPLSWAGAIAAVVGSLIALSQTHLKRALAYSTISQIGFVVAAWGKAVYLGAAHPDFHILMTAALVYAFFHALYKSQLFLGLGLVTDTMGSYQLESLKGGLSRQHRLRFIFAGLMFGYLSMAGIPGLAGHSGKTLLSFALDRDIKDVFIVAAGVLSVALALKLSRPFWTRGRKIPESESGQPTPQPPAPQGLASMIVLIQGVMIMALGLGLEPCVHFVLSLLGSSHRPSLGIFGIDAILKSTASVGLGMGVFFLSTSRYGKILLEKIRDRPRGFEGLFAALMTGSVFLAAWIYLAP